MIHEYSLYLASWEHLYLLPDGAPAGLPNSVFSRQPWAIIIFEHIYCDQNALKGEQNAFDQLKWTNSGLFNQLASSKHGIIKPVNTKVPLFAFINPIQTEFKDQHGITVEEAIRQDRVSVDELFQWRLKLLRPFLDQNKLVLYDWPLANDQNALPSAIEKLVQETRLTAPRVPLTKDFTNLTPRTSQIFSLLQDLEKEPLKKLRRGEMSQPDYLKLLTPHFDKYREVDLEIYPGTEQNFAQILRYRERFGARNGWRVLSQVLAEYQRGASAKEIDPFLQELDECMRKCFLPQMNEFGVAAWGVAKALLKLCPPVHKAGVALDVGKALRGAANPVVEAFRFFRGETR